MIDADGHIIEDKEKLRSYLEPPYNRRGGSLVAAEPWDGHLQGTLPRNKEWSPHRPSANDWLRTMDKNNMEFAYLYSTSAGDVSAIREKGYAIALCRAYNNYVHDEFARVSPRLKPLAVFPQQDPEEAAREIRRAVKEIGLAGVSIKTTGLTLPLGHRFYDPIFDKELVHFHVIDEIPHGYRFPHPAFDGLPTLDKFVKNDSVRKVVEMHRNFTLIGSPFILPPSTPKAQVQILSEAMRKTFRDSEFVPSFTKMTGAEPSPLLPEEQAKAIKEIPRDPETVNLFKKISGPDPLPSL